VTELFDLTGRVAIVTGAAGLLGPQHARALLELGASVFLTDVRFDAARTSVAALPAALRERAQALMMDVTNLSSVEECRRNILASHARVDILINNAAIDPKVDSGGGVIEASRVENFAMESWNLQVAVGLTGAFLCARVFGAHMAANGGGVILNVASDLSVIAPDQRLYRRPALAEDQQPVKPVTYSVIKAGLVGLTRYLATYWSAQGVRVNALSPGGVYAGQPEEFVAGLTRLIPLGRMATPEEYIGAIQFLCSDASKYMTGQNIVIDGGRTVL
jgi:NAD(P)-dependent dehydrogenase (short-subunit alcohol dehydrogenase family)